METVNHYYIHRRYAHILAKILRTDKNMLVEDIIVNHYSPVATIKFKEYHFYSKSEIVEVHKKIGKSLDCTEKIMSIFTKTAYKIKSVGIPVIFGIIRFRIGNYDKLTSVVLHNDDPDDPEQPYINIYSHNYPIAKFRAMRIEDILQDKLNYIGVKSIRFHVL